MFISQEIIQTQIQLKEFFEIEKQVKYKEIAQVRLKQLQFKKLRGFDKKNIKKLKPNFHKNCYQLDKGKHILALIDQQLIDIAIWVLEILA